MQSVYNYSQNFQIYWPDQRGYGHIIYSSILSQPYPAF